MGSIIVAVAVCVIALQAVYSHIRKRRLSGSEDTGTSSEPTDRTVLKRIVTLSAIWIVLTTLPLLTDIIGVLILHDDELYGLGLVVGLCAAPIAFGWPFHSPGSGHLLSYQALAIVLLLTWTWFTLATWTAMAFHVMIGGELNL